MGGPVFYSTNPWFATEVANKYRGGVHFAWVCECFDSSKAAAGTAAALIAPSSNPKRIYDTLYEDCKKEDRHSALIKGYKRKFRLLGRAWAGDKSISDEQCEDIIATVNSRSWKIWRPVLYVIPRAGIDAGRIQSVRVPDRAAYGPELQIADLRAEEFDIIELWTL